VADITVFLKGGPLDGQTRVIPDRANGYIENEYFEIVKFQTMAEMMHGAPIKINTPVIYRSKNGVGWVLHFVNNG
jgi:hypothetical protein